MKAGESKQFSPVVSGTTNTAVTWSLDPAGTGTITNSGLYKAPTQLAAAQRIRVKATSAADPSKSATSDVDLNPVNELSFTLNNNGLDTLVYKGVDYNYKYGEGLLTSLTYGEANTSVYAQFCTRSLNGSIVTHQCTSGSSMAIVTAMYEITGPNTITVDLSITNQSATDVIKEALFSTHGLASSQFIPSSHYGDASLTSRNYGSGRILTWVETTDATTEILSFCPLQYICKNQPLMKTIAPGDTKRLRVTGRFTNDMTSSFYSLAPEAYKHKAEAFPSVLNWPDRRPIMAMWVAEGTKTSDTNPRGYLQDRSLTVSDTQAFRQKVIASATRTRDLMNARPVRPQGIIIWDLEGQEFIHATTYIGDPRVFESGYAPEMNAAADDMFRIFRDAGYRVGVTIRPHYLEWGTELPTSCTYDSNRDFRSHYVKVNNPFQQRFHACDDPSGRQWSVFASGNGGQTVYKPEQILEVTNLLKSKVAYANRRWGVTLFYIDSAVWSGGAAIPASIIRELLRAYPDCLFIPEQESLPTMSTAIPYSDPRVSSDPPRAPLTWRWVYPTGAFAVAMGDCQGVCWSDKADLFRSGQKMGDIAIYGQPTQINTSHLDTIESMIQTARQESSSITVTDDTTGISYIFRGDVTAEKPYPVKMRVYFADSISGLEVSSTFCEAGQWLGENTCTLGLSSMTVSEIRYYDFSDALVRKSTLKQLR